MAAGLSDTETPFLPSHQIGELLFTPLVLALLFHLGFWRGPPSPSPRCLYCKLLSCPGASA